ncbi:hypothetical protein F4212_14155 [Candidatus Poribacteria bacterium]|nr:hypothetical protein [Candidatus Poribacteria bacterium]
MSIGTTTAGMSPSELTKRREILKQQWENRTVDEELLKRAWEAALRVATVLYQDYGASKVAIFGSLTELECFTENSDIDMVVWGISYNKCLDALWDTKGLTTKFKIDLIDFESTKGLFRQRILNQAIPIDKDVIDVQKVIENAYATLYAETEGIYVVNRDRLIQRISDEQTKIARTVRGIENALQDIDVIAENHRKYIEKTIASDLVEIYCGIERIFERIAREVDKHIPSGSKWHSDLLMQMAEHREKRPPVISQRTTRRLKRLLKFRHRMNHIYRYELIYEKAEKHAKRVSKLFDNVTEELETFIAYLSET